MCQRIPAFPRADQLSSTVLQCRYVCPSRILGGFVFGGAAHTDRCSRVFRSGEIYRGRLGGVSEDLSENHVLALASILSEIAGCDALSLGLRRLPSCLLPACRSDLYSVLVFCSDSALAWVARISFLLRWLIAPFSTEVPCATLEASHVIFCGCRWPR